MCGHNRHIAQPTLILYVSTKSIIVGTADMAILEEILKSEVKFEEYDELGIPVIIKQETSVDAENEVIPVMCPKNEDLAAIKCEEVQIKDEVDGQRASNSEKMYCDSSDISANRQIKNPTSNKNFKCQDCDFKSKHKGDLTQHLLVHSNVVPLQCSSCKKGFNKKRHLDVHLLRYHRENKELLRTITNKIHRCQFCTFKSIISVNLTTHMAYRHNYNRTKRSAAEKYQCQHCDYIALSKSNLRQHLLIHSNRRTYQCTACRIAFSHKVGLDTHILNNHKNNAELLKTVTHKIHFCRYCDFKSKNLGNLRAHVDRRHNLDRIKRSTAEKFQCHHCDYFAWKKSNLRQHLLVHSNRRTYQCTACMITFTNKVGLDSHILNNHEENEELLKTITHKIHCCQFCAYKSKSLGNLTTHMARHYNVNIKEIRREELQCEHCDYFAVNKNNLRQHLLIHSNRRTYQCTVCSTAFNHKVGLDSHILINHKGNEELLRTITNKILCCKFCEFKSINLGNLTAHLASRHNGNGEKQNAAEKVQQTVEFQCHHCDYITFKKNNLKKHLLIHLNLRTYQCTACRTAFNHKLGLDSHILNNHEDNSELMKTITNKIHCCQFCSFKSTNSVNLTTHMACRHNHDKTKQSTEKFQCQHCDYFSGKKSDLTLHLLVHSDIKPHQCTACTKSFNYKFGLDSHILNNHKENADLLKTITNKIHCCQFCSFKSIILVNLRKHVARHKIVTTQHSSEV